MNGILTKGDKTTRCKRNNSSIAFCLLKSLLHLRHKQLFFIFQTKFEITCLFFFIIMFQQILRTFPIKKAAAAEGNTYIYNSRCSLGRCGPKKIVNLGHSETDENKNQASSASMLPNDSEKYEDCRQTRKCAQYSHDTNEVGLSSVVNHKSGLHRN